MIDGQIDPYLHTPHHAQNDVNTFVKGVNPLGDPMQAAWLLKDTKEEMKQYVDTSVCWPQSADELMSAIQVR